MSADSKTLVRNLVITGFCLAVIVAALLAKGLDETTRKTVVGSALAYVVGLWTHSGRPRSDGGDETLTGPVLPVLCLAFLALGACNANGPTWAFHWPGEGSPREERLSIVGYGPTAGLLADVVELKPAAAPTCTVGRACMYALNSDGLLYTKDANEITLKLHAAQSYRTSASCAGLSAPANGDVCYDTGLGVFRYYSAGWTTGPTSDSLLMHLAGTETATGNKTFSGTTTFSGNVAMSTTKTLTVGANVLIGSVADKLNAAYLAIASQAIGDLLVADSTTTFARKAKGSDGDVLTMVSGAVQWTAPSSGVLGAIYGGQTNTDAFGASTVYLGALGTATFSATRVPLGIITRTGTLGHFAVSIKTAPGGADTVVATAQQSTDQGATWSDTTLTCTITGAAKTCTDTTHAPAVALYDWIAIKLVSSAGTAAGPTTAGMEVN